jgi:hypothetical protein
MQIRAGINEVIYHALLPEIVLVFGNRYAGTPPSDWQNGFFGDACFEGLLDGIGFVGNFGQQYADDAIPPGTCGTVQCLAFLIHRPPIPHVEKVGD